MTHIHSHEHAHKHEHSHAHEHTHKHAHGHHHHHAEGGIKSQILLLIVTAVLLTGAFMVEKYGNLPTWQLLIVYLIPYLLVGHETLKEAGEGILHGQLFNEHFLMSIATLGALCMGFFPGSETEFMEAVFVMLFFQVGELFEGYAEGKSRDSISHLMDIRPDQAHVERDGKLMTVSPEEILTGEIILIQPGEKIPLDGRIVEGSSSLNTIALTGESMPREVETGDEILAGCINLTGVIRVRTTKAFSESTVAQIISLVENADRHKSRSEAFITQFASIYTPIVVVLALLLAIVPPMFASSGFGTAFPEWLHRALIFLVVSCPCALVISVPLTFFGGLGGASRKGILVKGSNFMDALAKLDTVVFDKTGTLTRGVFAVEAVHPKDFNAEEILHLAAHVEHYSTHPIAEALRNAYPAESTDDCTVTEVREIAGQGICANVSGRNVCVGNAKMMESLGVQWHDCHRIGTIIHVAVDGVYAGHIIINDRIKEESAKAIADLNLLDIRHTVMLTGDREETAEDVARKLGIRSYYAGLLPTDKVGHVEQLLHTKSQGRTLAFAGDGINDAPVLKRADIGIAMGGLGSDAAIEAADVVLMDDNPAKIATAIRIARRTIGIARQNVGFAISIKVAILVLASMGLSSMGMAVFADVGVTVLAVLNAMRALKG